MNPTIIKIAPTMVVLAVMGYCCWPEPGVPGGASKDKTREISQSSLKPKAAPTPNRDPFEGSTKKAPTPKESAKSTTPVVKPAPTEDMIKQVASLTLKATFLSGERRLALINDRFYAEGESLMATTSKTAYLITAVDAQRVVLEHQGHRVELKYLDKPAKSAVVNTKAPKAKAAKK